MLFFISVIQNTKTKTNEEKIVLKQIQYNNHKKVRRMKKYCISFICPRHFWLQFRHQDKEALGIWISWMSWMSGCQKIQNISNFLCSVSSRLLCLATKPDLQNLSLTRIPLKKAIAWLFALKLSWKLEWRCCIFCADIGISFSNTWLDMVIGQLRCYRCFSSLCWPNSTVIKPNSEFFLKVNVDLLTDAQQNTQWVSHQKSRQSVMMVRSESLACYKDCSASSSKIVGGSFTAGPV